MPKGNPLGYRLDPLTRRSATGSGPFSEDEVAAGFRNLGEGKEVRPAGLKGPKNLLELQRPLRKGPDEALRAIGFKDEKKER